MIDHPLYDDLLDGPITCAAVVERAVTASRLPDDPPQFDPVTILVLTAAISAAVSWLVEHCLDRLFASDVQSPNLVQRTRLRLFYVQPAIAQAVTKNGVRLTMREREALEQRVMAGLMGAGKGLTAGDLVWLKEEKAGAKCDAL